MLYISKTTEAELPKLYKLERLCHEDPWTLGMLQDCLTSGYLCHTFHLANISDEGLPETIIEIPHLEKNACCINPIGFMMNQIILDECHLLTLCIHPDLQGKGLAYTALRWFIDLLRTKQIKCMLLEVRVSNHAAVKLYQKLGFQQIGIRKKYYETSKGREDAIVMKLNL